MVPIGDKWNLGPSILSVTFILPSSRLEITCAAKAILLAPKIILLPQIWWESVIRTGNLLHFLFSNFAFMI